VLAHDKCQAVPDFKNDLMWRLCVMDFSNLSSPSFVRLRAPKGANQSASSKKLIIIVIFFKKKFG
jgi:hypothetical protein